MRELDPAPDMLAEYDFRGGIRGKYADRFDDDATAVVLDPDVAAIFPDSTAVNEALRFLLILARRQVAGPSEQ